MPQLTTDMPNWCHLGDLKVLCASCADWDYTFDHSEPCAWATNRNILLCHSVGF